jgi:hypothetical protein
MRSALGQLAKGTGFGSRTVTPGTPVAPVAAALATVARAAVALTAVSRAEERKTGMSEVGAG